MLRFLFSFNGRINRAKFWAILIGASFVFAPVVVAILTLESKLSIVPDSSLFRGNWQQSPAQWASVAAILATYLLFIWFALATAVKRLHDRNKSAWWLAIYYGPMIVLFAILGFFGPYALLKFPMPRTFLMVLFAIAWVMAAWYVIEIYFLPGTDGDNRFGPDPRGRKISDLANI